MEPKVKSQIPKETSPRINKSTDSAAICITLSEIATLENTFDIPPNLPNSPSQNEPELINSASPNQEKSAVLVTTILEETTSSVTTDKEVAQAETSIATTFSSLPERVEQPPIAKDNTIFTNYSTTTNNLNDETQISNTILPINSSSKELIIVRVKRKRNEEPLDAFVVQKMLNGNLHNKKAKKEESHVTEKTHTTVDAPTTYFRFAETVDEMTFEHSAKTLQLEERIRNRLRKNQKDEDLKKRFKDHHGKKRDQFKEDKHTARYQIIQNRRYKNNSDILINRENNDDDNNMIMNGITESLKVFDAVKQVDHNDEKLTISSKPTHRDGVMEKFLPMVMDYMSHLNIKEHDDDDEYVYDVFYRDDNFFKELEDHYRNVASLVWIEDDDNEYLLDEVDVIETDDEDSNAENYYTHDYPDEEEDDEKWEEDSDYDSERDFYTYGNQSSDEEEHYA
ncbi:4299_t:CDS:10 [Ambispora leptoticha]|uniref:Probable RNA polymerase II nuclear localization protein SLC7A6OS n=1 Tax=Ambispora leptoticha TaxID=144679 RepID=A0A9N8Z905_9GLOM|nr:4299_t:CDS:10 [Ambispora leptoticha]